MYVVKGKVRGIPYSLSVYDGGAEKSYEEYIGLTLADKEKISDNYKYNGHDTYSMKYGMSCATFVSTCIQKGISSFKRTAGTSDIQKNNTEYVQKGSATEEDYKNLLPGDYLYTGAHVVLIAENDVTNKKLTTYEQTPPNGSDNVCPNQQQVEITLEGQKRTAYTRCM